jgi:transcriptional regulator with XRE-family HTH domain
MELKDQIRVARESVGFDQAKLAALVGVSKQAVIWWESGENVPRSQRLRSLEEVLKVKLNVTGGSDDGALPTIQGLKPEHVTLAVMISRLPKDRRDALITIVKGLSGPDRKLQGSSARRGIRAGADVVDGGEFRVLNDPVVDGDQRERKVSTPDRADRATRGGRMSQVVAARTVGRK